jgi:site-specific DNA-methyltransferase (cytosine-N4-specific)
MNIETMATYTTRQVADMAGVHKDTLLRWLRDDRLPEPGRDRNGWRVFTSQEAAEVVTYAKGSSNNTSDIIAENQNGYHLSLPYSDAISKLSNLDWDFVDANTGYLTHSIHPYPAKFIPQIPNTLIQELSSVGETVVDLFCGSGTTLVEARRLGRHAVGIDANPLACLISCVKANSLSDFETQPLYQLIAEIEQLVQHASIGKLPLFPDLPAFPKATKQYTFNGMTEWFDAPVIDELSFIREKCLALKEGQARKLALVAFSSIIVAVSRQDSETRYVRRDKNIKQGDVLKQFNRALTNAIERVLELSREVDSKLTTQIHEANILDPPEIGTIDLVVCSPPYPNAFSYHLYHRTRMLWLGMNQPKFKQQEIGSHRKYSSKGIHAATANTFRAELSTILAWLKGHLRPHRHACFVIGDSIIKGETIKNDEVLISAASEIGFQVEANLSRHLQSTKKYFNPTIGKIKNEHLVILRNQ